MSRLQEACDRFNEHFKVGDEVLYWSGPKEGDGKRGVVSYPAQVMGGHSPVVYIKGKGAILLTHISRAPE